MGVNSLPKTVTQQRRGYDLNPGPSASKSSTLTSRLPSHPQMLIAVLKQKFIVLFIIIFGTVLFAVGAGVSRAESLQQLLTSSDCITLHCSRQSQRGATCSPVINHSTLRQMRRGTYLYNVPVYDK